MLRKVIGSQFLAILIYAVIFAGCNGGGTPVGTAVDQSSDLPESSVSSERSRDVMAVYDATIDPVKQTFTVTPDNRTAQYHFPLTQMFPNVLKITGYGFTPNFWADIKLVHPFPGSGIDAFDPRVIAILPANPGVRFIYPVLGVGGNNAVVSEPDGYTKLFDNLGGSIPGNVNPFKAYFKDQPNRVWSSTGVTEETQRWQMNLAGFGGPMQFKLVVDVSTNYPATPTPDIDNAQEPVKIIATAGSGLTPFGGTARITVTTLDWSGYTSNDAVLIEAPDLFDGTVALQYHTYGPLPRETNNIGPIPNSHHAPEGEYKFLAARGDQTTASYLYGEFSINVSYNNAGGALEWAIRAGDSRVERPGGITALSDDSTVMTGYFYGSTKFGPGEPNETVMTSSGEDDIFVAQYNPDGSLAWAKRAGGSSYDSGYGIIALSDDSTVVTGRFCSSAKFGQGEPNQTTLVSAGNNDVFIAKYNPDGTLAWAKRAGGSETDFGLGITALSDNSFVVSGKFNATATFGLGEPNQTILTSAGYNDIFVARYNPNGTLAWAKCAGSLYTDLVMGITSLSDGSTVLTGYYNDTISFGKGEINETVLLCAGSYDIFIARYNSDGTLAWAKRAGGTSYDYGNGVISLSDNSSVVTGTFYESATFGLGETNETVLTSPAGNSDIFIARYESNGSLAWAKRAGGRHDDNGFAITALSDNSTIVTGFFNSSATFGPGEINETQMDSFGINNNEVFIAKYNPDGTLAWVRREGNASTWGCYEITTLHDNSTVLANEFLTTITLGPGEINETTLISINGQDIFVARFAP